MAKKGNYMGARSKIFIILRFRTTNIIERSFREARRRTRPTGCFENEANVTIIIFGAISGLNKN